MERRRTIERYELCDRIASGGMGSVHLGHLHGSAGFRRIVAIKRMHPELAGDPDFVRAFIEEARLAARIRHPNVVPILDALTDDSEFFLVFEYVHGEALHRLIRGEEPPPVAIAAAIGCDLLEGLDAAHRAADESGAPLEIIHRDVSPQNVLVGIDGHARILDFGVATASRRARGPARELRGKLSYMAPEQIVSGDVGVRSDVYSAAVVLWETLTGQRLFKTGTSFAEIIEATIAKPSAINPAVPPALDDALMTALERNPMLRHASAREMSVAIERAVKLASEREVGDWVQSRAGSLLRERAERIAVIERSLTKVTSFPEAPAPQFAEADGVVVTRTRSFAEPNAILRYPDLDPTNEQKVTITAKRVMTASSAASPTHLLTPAPRTRALAKIAGALVLALISLAVMMRPAETPPPAIERPATHQPAIQQPAILAVHELTLPSPPPAVEEAAKGESPPVRRRSPRARRAKRPAIDRCDPPFWIDDEGLRRLKPGCD